MAQRPLFTNSFTNYQAYYCVVKRDVIVYQSGGNGSYNAAKKKWQTYLSGAFGAKLLHVDLNIN